MKTFGILLFSILAPLLFIGQQINFQSYTLENGLTDNYIESIAQDKKGYLWFASRNGLNRFNGTEFRNFLSDVNDPCSLPFNYIVKIFVDDNNILWLSSYGSNIASYNPETECFKLYSFEEKANSTDLPIIDIFYNQKHQISLFTGSEIYILQDTLFRLSPNAVYEKKQSSDSLKIGNIQWEISSRGIEREKDGKTDIYHSGNTAEITSNAFSVLFKDREDNLWFGSHGGGIIKVDAQTDHLRYFSKKKLQIENNIITDFFIDSDRKLWVATDGGGISVFDENFKHIQQINVPDYKINNSVLDICTDSDGTIWAAGWNSGLFKINSQTYEIVSYKSIFEKKGLTNNLKSVATKGDTVFCGSYGSGLILFNKRNKELISFNMPGKGFLLSQPYINTVICDSSQNIWVGTNRGLYQYSQNKMRLFPIDTLDSLNNDKKVIMHISESRQNSLYLSTPHQLYIFDKANTKISKYKSNIAEPYSVKFAMQDEHKNLWMGSYDKLYRIDSAGNQSSIKLTKSAFTVDIFNKGAIYESRGAMYIGTQKGFYVLQKDSLNIRCQAPPIHFESISIKNKTLLPRTSQKLSRHIDQLQELELLYNDFPLSLDFASVYFNEPEAIQYSYRFQHEETSWTAVKGNSILFNNIAPGTYMLELRNTNKYGIWSNDARKLKIIIAPPFWQEWWFRSSALTLIAILLYLLYRLRVRQLNEQKIKLQHEVEKQTSQLRSKNKAIEEQKQQIEDQADNLQEKLLVLHDQKEDLVALNTELSEQSKNLIETNSQLNSAVKTKNKLLSIIGHDIKNPFSVILMTAKHLVQYKTDNAELNAQHKVVYRASKNVYSILTNLLDWSLTQSGLISYNPSNINCKRFMLEVIENNKEYSDQKDITISLSCEENICCYADKQMIGIAIRNLLQNSVKFTPEGGRISILCSRKDDSMLTIEIIDTGIGMDSKLANSLFELNTVISEKGTHGEEGRGLGLLVVNEFVGLNKGSIDVTSTKNKGTKFTISLPLGEEENSHQPIKKITQKNALAEHSIPNNEIQILLVEDNKSLREQLSKNISEHYIVTECDNAFDAIEKCKTTKVDLIVSDIIMENMDGISLCRTVKTKLQLNIPVILITGADDSQIQVDAYKTGADAFIKKPFEFDVLLARMQNLIQNIEKSSAVNFNLSNINLKQQDEQFFERLKHEVELGIPDPSFSVEMLAEKLLTSRASLFRKTKKILGISPSEYIQLARLQIASKMLKTEDIRISEIAYMIGFSDPQYFSNCFSKHFGTTPTNYRSKHNQK